MTEPVVIMLTSPYFRGVITNTPSGTAYNVMPGQIISVAPADASFLLTFGFTAAPVSPGAAVAVSDGTTTVAAASTIDFTSGATVTDAGSGIAHVAIEGGGSVPPAPFFGLSLQTGWTRPGLAIGGSGNNFTEWLNQTNFAIGLGDVVDNTFQGDPVTPGTGNYAPGDTITLGGGTIESDGVATQLTVTDTQVVAVALASPGSGVAGPVTLQGTTGTPNTFVQVTGTVGVGGALNADGLVITVAGDYTSNPIDLAAEPMTTISGTLSGATLTLTMGVLSAIISDGGSYTIPPTNPISQSASSGTGTGATWNATYNPSSTAIDNSGGGPLVVQSMCPVPPLVTVGGFNALSGLLKTIGTPPWTIKVASAGVNGPAAGQSGSNGGSYGVHVLVLYNASLDVALGLSAYANGSGGWYIRRYTEVSKKAENSLPTVVQNGLATGAYFSWWAVTNDGANITFGLSGEGAMYLDNIYQEALAEFMVNITHVGFGINVSDAGQQLSILWNWVES
jgi:hypothetical protein